MATYYVDTAVGNDVNAGTSAGSGNAWATIAKAAATVAAGDLVYIKASGTYTLTVTVTISLIGTAAGGKVTWEGYTTTPGARDGRPTITSATNSVNLLSINNGAAYHTFRHLKFTHTAGTRGAAIAGIGTGGQSDIGIEDCDCDGCKYLFDGSTRNVLGLKVSGTRAINCTSGVIVNNSGTAFDFIDGCFFYNNQGAAYSANNSSTVLIVTDSVLANNARAITDGGIGSTRTFVLYMRNCTIANNATEGITNANASTTWSVLNLTGNIIYGNAGYGIGLLNTTASNEARGGANRNNFYGNNTSGNRNNLSAGYSDVALTADPFVDSSNGNYALNNASGGGALCRAASYPGAFPGATTTGYLDGGAVQRRERISRPSLNLGI